MRFFILTYLVFIDISYLGAQPNSLSSTCFGETHHGKINNAYQLPFKGKNFKAYSQLGWYLGRTYVHSSVAGVLLETYAQLASLKPTHSFVYGETGWPKGGPFKPHKTHQNGLSVDFMVPVIDTQVLPIELPRSASNQYGYQVDFDVDGKSTDFSIDFEAMALHLRTLDEVAQQHKIGIARIFFAPDLQQQLFDTEHGKYLQEHLVFNSQQAWVRHDDHYHVDFKVSCQLLNDR